ncbi:unnamed protein product [Trichobilharzia regenti]|nr:unnamed protein product [Trichobilharzia regenti]
MTSTPSINYLSSIDGQYESLHCFKGVNNNNMVADERNNNSEVDETLSQMTKSRSNSRGEFRTSNINSPTVSSTNDVAPCKNVKMSELMTMNEIFRRNGQAKPVDSSSKLSEATRKPVPPLRLSASPSPSALVKVADSNQNSSNGNEMTKTSPPSEGSKLDLPDRGYEHVVYMGAFPREVGSRLTLTCSRSFVKSRSLNFENGIRFKQTL